MHCREVRQLLVHYRELEGELKKEVDQHLRLCPTCMAAFEAYSRQDRLLATLPTIEPSPEWREAVVARTVRRAQPRQLRARALAVAIVVLLAFTLAVGQVVQAAEGALPGDVLYPVKRVAENVRLGLTLDPRARAVYKEELAQKRREEVRQVLELARQVKVSFEGELKEVSGSLWRVDGLQVIVKEGVWVGQPPLGSTVGVKAQTAGGALWAQRVWLVRGPQPTLTATVVATLRGVPAAEQKTVTKAPPACTKKPSSEVISPTRTPSITKRPSIEKTKGQERPTPTGVEGHATPKKELRTRTMVPTQPVVATPASKPSPTKAAGKEAKTREPTKRASPSRRPTEKFPSRTPSLRPTKHVSKSPTRPTTKIPQKTKYPATPSVPTLRPTCRPPYPKPTELPQMETPTPSPWWPTEIPAVTPWLWPTSTRRWPTPPAFATPRPTETPHPRPTDGHRPGSTPQPPPTAWRTVIPPMVKTRPWHH